MNESIVSGATVSEAIVVVNAGSTSLKFATYAVDASRSLPLLCRGEIENMESDPHFVVTNAAGKQLGQHEWSKDRRSTTKQRCTSSSLGWKLTRVTRS